jgi:cytochrome c oxidase subunit 1
VTLLATFAAVYYWFPKMFGRMMNETLGRLHFWLTIVSFYCIFLTQHFIGIAGTPRRYYAFMNYEFLEGISGYVLFISIAGFVMGGAQLIFMFNFLWSMKRGKASGPNPWEATTLEWTLPSPPPHLNWGEDNIPVVHRWAYEYSPEGQEQDFLMQDAAPVEAEVAS